MSDWGGSAGMEAVRVAAQRPGHTLVLFESSARLGDQVRTAAKAKYRPHLGRHIAWLEGQLREHGVDVRREQLRARAGPGGIRPNINEATTWA